LSSNIINLQSPYDGLQNAKLTIRKSPRFGKDVYLSIERGQIVLPYDNERIRIKFDDENSRWYGASQTSDHSSNLVFLTDYKTIVRKLLNSKIVRIELTLFQSGNHVLEFDTEGLLWDRP
jgi:hypothetical protein